MKSKIGAVVLALGLAVTGGVVLAGCDVAPAQCQDDDD